MSAKWILHRHHSHMSAHWLYNYSVDMCLYCGYCVEMCLHSGYFVDMCLHSGYCVDMCLQSGYSVNTCLPNGYCNIFPHCSHCGIDITQYALIYILLPNLSLF